MPPYPKTHFESVRLSVSLLSAAIAIFAGACLFRHDAGSPSAHYAVEVDFIPQQATNDCGTAALVMLMRFHGGDPDKDRLRQELTIPALGGTIPALLMDAAQSAGYEALLRQHDPDAVRTALLSGNPAMVLLAATDGSPVGHFVVVTGMTEHGDHIRMHDGQHPDRWMPIETFERRWRDSDFLTITLGSRHPPASPLP